MVPGKFPDLINTWFIIVEHETRVILRTGFPRFFAVVVSIIERIAVDATASPKTSTLVIALNTHIYKSTSGTRCHNIAMVVVKHSAGRRRYHQSRSIDYHAYYGPTKQYESGRRSVQNRGSKIKKKKESLADASNRI